MKKLLIPVLLILAIIAAYWVAFGNPFKKIFGQTPVDVPNVDTITTDTSTSPGGNFKPVAAPAKDANGFPLSIGSTGLYVKNIQLSLNSRFGSELVVDGIFGTKTAKALSAHGYNPDAIYWKHYYDIIGVKI